MKVLKAGTTASDAQTTYNFIDLRQRCDDYVDRVRQQCRDWVTDAQNEAESIRRTAYEEGRRQGLQDGLADAATQIDRQSEVRATEAIAKAVETVIPALDSASREIAMQRDAWMQRWERDAVAMALAVAEKLTHQAVAVDPEILRSRVVETIRLAAGESQVTVRLHPDDVTAINTMKDLPAEVRFEADTDLQPGDCIASTGEGLVDGRLQTQLETITRELFE